MKPFNLQEALAGKPVVTRMLESVKRLIHVPDAREAASRLLVVLDNGRTYQTTEQGTYYESGSPSHRDLFMASTKKEGWINIYPASFAIPAYGKAIFNNWPDAPSIRTGTAIFSSERQANEHAESERIAVVKIEWEE